MELVTCFMIALIALGACLGCPGSVNPEGSNVSNDSTDSRLEEVIFPNADHPEMINGRYKDGPAGPDTTKT